MITPWPFDGLMPMRYGAILADPPWAYAMRSPKGYDKSPEAQAIWLSTAFSTRAGAKVNLLTTEEEEMMEAIRRGELPTQQG